MTAAAMAIDEVRKKARRAAHAGKTTVDAEEYTRGAHVAIIEARSSAGGG